MKRKNLIGLAGVFLFLVINKAGFTQKKEYSPPDEEKTFSANFGIGYGWFIGGEPGLAPQAAVQYTFKRQFIQLQIAGLSTIGLFNSDYNDNIDVGLLYGISHRQRKFKFAAAAGVGYYSYFNNINKGGGGLFDPPGSNPDYVRTCKSTVGFPLNASILFQPRKFGVGVQVNANMNSVKSFVSTGILYSFRF